MMQGNYHQNQDQMGPEEGRDYNQYSSTMDRKFAAYEKFFENSSIGEILNDEDSASPIQVAPSNLTHTYSTPAPNRLTSLKSASTNSKPIQKTKSMVPIARTKKGTAKQNKRFPCEVCGKIFNERGNLQVHLRVHTNERPYKCRYPGCPRNFTTIGNRNDHERRHTKDKPYKCTENPGVCCAEYYRKYQLIRHITSKHNGNSKGGLRKSHMLPPFTPQQPHLEYQNGPATQQMPHIRKLDSRAMIENFAQMQSKQNHPYDPRMAPQDQMNRFEMMRDSNRGINNQNYAPMEDNFMSKDLIPELKALLDDNDDDDFNQFQSMSHMA